MCKTANAVNTREKGKEGGMKGGTVEGWREGGKKGEKGKGERQAGRERGSGRREGRRREGIEGRRRMGPKVTSSVTTSFCNHRLTYERRLRSHRS